MKPENTHSALDLNYLQTWIGRTEERLDNVTPAPIRGMNATLDRLALDDQIDTALPALWHWLYFLSATPTLDLALDGHAKKGGFLPPVPLARRMWAGGRVEFLAPLKVGEDMRRVSTIASIEHKTGNSGELVFVAVNHDIYQGERLAIRERQDLVYRDKPSGDAPPYRNALPPARLEWSRIIELTAALLFRYSALTFNAHRIHYDRDYAIEVDGYEDLVVHGPLVATLLLDVLIEMYPNVVINEFDYRGIRPLLAMGAFCVEGCFVEQHTEPKSANPAPRKVQLWAKDQQGWLTMSAKALITIQA